MHGKQGCRSPSTVEGGDGFGCDLVAADVTRADDRLDEGVFLCSDLRCARFGEKEGIIGAAGDAPDDATEVAKPIEPAEAEGWGTGDASGHALGQGTTGDDEVIAGVLGQPLSG
jgi:hypothetical protein